MKKLRLPMTRERIIRTSLSIVNRKGLDDFSMRRLAAALSVEPMSLYHYFSSRIDLLNAVLDHLIESFQLGDPSLGWDERLRAAAYEWRRIATKNPGFYPFLAVHRFNTEICLRLLESFLAIFKDAGLSPKSAALALRVFGYFLVGAGFEESAGYSRGPSARKVLSSREEKKRFPLVHGAGNYFGAAHREEIFELGLEGVMNTVRQLAECSDACPAS